MSFVISQVNDGSSNYENLQNYILGGKRSAPTDVPRQLAPSVRLQNGLPTDQPSSGLRPIPTSSQKPFQQTNQRIPYARHFFKNDDELLGNYSIETGDLVFVHKSERRMGHDVNRCIRVMGLPQLNRRLEADEPGHTTFGPMSDALRARVAEVRREAAEVARTRLQWAQSTLARAREHCKPEVPAAEAEVTARTRELDGATATATAGRGALAVDDLDMTVDWRALTFPEDFVPDGVVIGVDDGNNDSLVNVCVGGPTAMRNATPTVRLSIDQRTPPQSVDTRAHVLDRVYVGLHHKRVGGKVKLEYRLFTGRMFESVRGDLCVAWRIGTVLDSKRVGNMGPDNQHLFVNVIVEECTVAALEEYYGLKRSGNEKKADSVENLKSAAAALKENAEEAIKDRQKMSEKARAARDEANEAQEKAYRLQEIADASAEAAKRANEAARAEAEAEAAREASEAQKAAEEAKAKEAEAAKAAEEAAKAAEEAARAEAAEEAEAVRRAEEEEKAAQLEKAQKRATFTAARNWLEAILKEEDLKNEDKKVIKNQLKSLKEQLKNIAQNSDDPTDRAIAGEEYETLQEMITIDDEFARPDNMKDEEKKTNIVRKLINFFKKRGQNS